MVDQHDIQRIARLTPLDDVLARITARVAPVPPRPAATVEALGRVLAEDVVTGPCPSAPTALRDGWAVDSTQTADAGSYAPAPLSAAVLIDVGQPLPPGADAVAPFDAVIGRDGRYEAVEPLTPGEGVLAQAADVRAGALLRRAGARLRVVDIAVLSCTATAQVMVREPLVRLVKSRSHGDARLEVTRGLIELLIVGAGGVVKSEPGTLAGALADESVHAVAIIGGTGSGREDASVHTLAQLGQVEAHGIAVSPGETAGF